MPRATFRIHYGTRWGEELFLEHKTPAGQGGFRLEVLPLEHVGDGCWMRVLEVGETADPFAYRYLFRGVDGERQREPLFRRLRVTGAALTVLDQWYSPEWPEAAFFRQAFAGVIFQPDRQTPARGPAAGARRLRLTLRAPRVTAGHRICVSGSHSLLGDWDPTRAVVLSGESYPLWEVDLPQCVLAPGVEFKFGLWSDAAQRLVSYETGSNRRFDVPPSEAEVVILHAEHFRHEMPWRGAGVAIPLFALRSERGYGIGEFADLESFAAWAAGCGMHLIQLLPVNDTSTDCRWTDSYPYSAISTAALHPIYLNVERLFEESMIPLPGGYMDRREALNRLPQLDYEAVMRDKLEYLRQLYGVAGAKTCRSRAFQAFFRAAAEWLRPYAAFCRLRDRHRTADFTSWGEHAVYSERAIRPWFRAEAPEHAEVMFHCFLQFHLKRQLDQALAAGHALGVAFKGDLPIGINRRSVEAWIQPELFHMDRQTGAPPDAFSTLGQNWGFPTYNWRRMETDGYRWWQRRLHHMSACFDALRIDHILGFFRIWEIPLQYPEGLRGHFNPALPLSPEEIRESGFTRAVRDFTVPAVSEENLPRFFGSAAGRVARELLVMGDDGFYRCRAGLEQAEAFEAWLAGTCPPEEGARIAASWERFAYEVLFLEDPDQPGRFHPRINLEDSMLCQSLPEEEQAILGSLHADFFYRRHRDFWEVEAMKKLPPLMDATAMLICGEDLGMIPDAVPVVLRRLGLLSLEVQSMPKRLGQQFGNPFEYPYLSVCTTSTHDTPTIRGWWEEDAAARAAFYRELMQAEDDVPREATPEICQFIVRQNLEGASMWCILPLQDWLGIDSALRHPSAGAERINVPANPRQYWRYRMHLTIDALRQATAFNERVSSLIAQSGRRL